MIGHEHVPSERSPIGEARHKRDLPLVGGATMQPAQQAIGGLVGAIEPSMDRGPITCHHLMKFGLDQRHVVPIGSGSDGDGATSPRFGVVHNDLRWGARAGAHGGQHVALPTQLAVHSPRHLSHDPGLSVHHTESAKAVFVARERHLAGIGRHRKTPLPKTPSGAGMFEWFVDQHSLTEPQVVPSRVVTNADQLRVGQATWLLQRTLRADRFDASISERCDHAYGVLPRHVWRAPCLPTHRRRIG